MAVAETAHLVAQMDWTDRMSPGVQKTVASVNRLGTSVGGVTSRASKGFATLGGNIKKLAASPLGLIGLAGGIYGVSHAIEDTIHSASSFQQEMELIRTQTGKTQAEVEAMSQSVLDMAKSVGTGPEELARGLYHVESAGFQGAKALDILRIAAEGAKVGNANLEDVTNALVAAEQAGVKGAEDIGAAMGTLNAIVGAGNLRMQDLASSLSSGILPAAKTFGVSLQSVGAALATMTDEGVPAEEAATRLRMTLSLLGAPTSKAAEQLKAIGIGQLRLAQDMRSPGGIVTAVEDLRQHMIKAGMIGPDGNINSQGARLLSKAFGGGRSSSTIMTLVGNLGLLQQKQEQVTKGAGDFGDAWAATQQTSAFRFAQFGAALQKVQIMVGTKLLPTLTDAASGLADFLDSHGTDIADAFKSGADSILDMGKAITAVLLPALGAIGDIWRGIPDDFKKLIVGGFIVNKLTGGAITGGIGGLLRGIVTGGARGGIGGAIGGATGVVPVFVTNPGFGAMGGGPEGLLAKAAGGIGLGTALGVGTIVASLAAIGVTLKIQNDQSGQQARDLKASLDAGIETKTPAQLQTALDGVNKGIADLQSNPLNVLVQGDALEQLKSMRDELKTKLGQPLEPKSPAERGVFAPAGRGGVGSPGGMGSPAQLAQAAAAFGVPGATRDMDKLVSSGAQTVQRLRDIGINLRNLGQTFASKLTAYQKELRARERFLRGQSKTAGGEERKLIAAKLDAVDRKEALVAAGITALRTSKNPALTAVGNDIKIAQARLAGVIARRDIAKSYGDTGRVKSLSDRIKELRGAIVQLGKRRDRLEKHPVERQRPARTTPGVDPSRRLGRELGPRGAATSRDVTDLSRRLGQELGPPLRAAATSRDMDKVVGQITSSGGKQVDATATAASMIGSGIDASKVAVAGAVSRGASETTRAGYYAGGQARDAGYTTARAMDSAASRIVAAVYAARPVIQSTNISRSTTVIERAGPTGGSGNTNRAPYGRVP